MQEFQVMALIYWRTKFFSTVNLSFFGGEWEQTDSLNPAINKWLSNIKWVGDTNG